MYTKAQTVTSRKLRRLNPACAPDGFLTAPLAVADKQRQGVRDGSGTRRRGLPAGEGWPGADGIGPDFGTGFVLKWREGRQGDEKSQRRYRFAA